MAIILTVRRTEAHLLRTELQFVSEVAETIHRQCIISNNCIRYICLRFSQRHQDRLKKIVQGLFVKKFRKDATPKYRRCGVNNNVGNDEMISRNACYWIWITLSIGYNNPKVKRISEMYSDVSAFYYGGISEWRLCGIFSQKDLERFSSTGLDDAKKIVDRCIECIFL